MLSSSRLLKYGWVAAYLLACTALYAAEQARPVHRIEGLGTGTVPLDSGWAFHAGDDAAWASPSYDDSSWPTFTSETSWGKQGLPAREGFGWYRYHMTVVPGPNAPKELALLIPAIDDAYELYWNGVLVGKNGSLPPHPDWYLAQAPQTYGLGPITSGVLAVRVWKAPLTSNDPDTLGGFEAPPIFGGSDSIAAAKAQMDFEYLHQNQVDFGLNSLYGLLGLLALFAWMRDRSQRVLLCMAGYTLMQVFGFLLGSLEIPMPFILTVGLLQPVLMLQDVSLWYLILLLLKLDENPKLLKIVRIWVIVFCAAFLIDGLTTAAWGYLPSVPLQILDGVLTVIFTPLETLPIALVVMAVIRRKKLDSARWTVAICAFFSEMVFVLRNASSQFVRFTHWGFARKLAVPLFHINGNPFPLREIANVLVLSSVIYAVYRYSIEYRQQQAALEQEIRNAREIQQVLIPETLPTVPGFTLTSAYRPAQEVGGDFFQIIPIEGGSTLVVLGDVSGKGLKAAMAVSLIVGAVRALAEDYPDPARLLTQLNRRLCGRLQGGFATCIILRIEAGSEGVLASAGHPAPYLNDTELELPGALPLGLSADAVYDEVRFPIGIGDHFSLYTDGLLEARSRTGEIYSFSRLQSLFATNPDASTATEAAVRFGQEDDITVLTLTRLDLGEDASVQVIVPTLVEG